MNTATHRNTVRCSIVIAMIGALLGSGIGVAEASTPYIGMLTYGSLAVTVNCNPSSQLPTSLTYSVPYNATHLTRTLNTTVYAQFTDTDPTTTATPTETISAQPVPTVISARTQGIITETVTIPTNPDARNLPYAEIGLGHLIGNTKAVDGPVEDLYLNCNRNPAVLDAPSVVSVSNPCLGTTTVRFMNSGVSKWGGLLILPSTGVIRGPIVLEPATAAVVKIGSALHGAESFLLLMGTNNTDTDSAVISPLIAYSAPCKPGRPATTLTAVRRGTRNVLTATIKPGFAGAPVKFFRVVNGHRTLVGTARTGPMGKAVFKAPRRANTRYVAVVGATHWSVATTTPSRLVQ